MCKCVRHLDQVTLVCSCSGESGTDRKVKEFLLISHLLEIIFVLSLSQLKFIE